MPALQGILPSTAVAQKWVLSRLYKLTILEPLRKPERSVACVLFAAPPQQPKTFKQWMAPSCFCCSPKSEEGGEGSRRKSKVTSRKRRSSLALISIDVMVLLPRRTANRRKPIKNYHPQRDWGKQVTAAGCWAPLWEQLEMRLRSTHQKASSHAWNKALDKKRFVKLKIDLTLGFSSERPEQMKSPYINSSALWTPQTLRWRKAKYVEQTLCLPHPKTQLRNQSQRQPPKDWSAIKRHGSSPRQPSHPAHAGPAPRAGGERAEDGTRCLGRWERRVPILQHASTRVGPAGRPVQRRWAEILMAGVIISIIDCFRKREKRQHTWHCHGLMLVP